MAVSEKGWITSGMFSTAVGFGYITPGPVLITATFIGYQTAGFGGNGGNDRRILISLATRRFGS
jgi:chromate transport protein ChrA